jgi:hypothetical protein
MDVGETGHCVFESSLVMFGGIEEDDKISPPDVGEHRIGSILCDMHHLAL